MKIRGMEFQSAPIVVCLLVGVALAFVLTRAPKKPAKAPPNLTAPFMFTNETPDTNFMAYIATGHSNLLFQMSLATNPAERAKWLDFERRFTNIDWADVAVTLRRASNMLQIYNTTNKP